MSRTSRLIPLDRLQTLRVQAVTKRPSALRLLPMDSDRRPVCRTGVPGLPAVPQGFRGKAGERWDLEDARGRLRLVGCGPRPAATASLRAYWQSVAFQIVEALRETGEAQADLAAPLPDDAVEEVALGLQLAGYHQSLYRSQPAPAAPGRSSLRLPGIDRNALTRAQATADAVNWARALVDAPANHLTPAAFADEVRALAALGVRVEVLGFHALQKLGAHGLLAVGGSSQHKPCMVVARWSGRGGQGTDLAIVGKGLTFDGGGLNLKMMLIEKMKFDMGGAAAAAGAIRLLAQLKAPVNVAVVLPLCENVIGGDAYRPGDVIGSLEGLTIEVANTDAEGRIVVADGISYAKRFKPRLLVDIATLTGSISMTLHQEFAGLYANDEPLAQAIAQAAAQTGDHVWRMPLSPLQDYIVDSDIADVRNVGASDGLGLPAGSSSVAGAKFLERFARGQRWAHLDMASTVLSSRRNGAVKPGPTGWGVRLLADLAQMQVAD